VKFIEEQSKKETTIGHCIGLVNGKLTFTPLSAVEKEMDHKHRRPETQWWWNLRDVQQVYPNIYIQVPNFALR
jgi:hypothetical protein